MSGHRALLGSEESLRPRRRRAGARPDLLPLLDVIFLLVAVLLFSVVRMVRAWSMPLDLAQATSGELAKVPQVWLLSVDAEGRCFASGREHSSADLVAEALGRLALEPELTFLIEADRHSPYGQVFALLDGLRAGGATRVYLIGEPPGESGG